MKQHIKKIQFLVIALFTIMLSSCSDDLYHQGSKPVAKNKTVSIEEFKRNTGLHNFSKTFKIPKDNTIAYRNADGSYELSDFDINFDYIKQVVVENKISYTFNIVPKIVTSKSIFNLVVYNHDGNWETSIIELIPTDENFDKLLAGIDNKFEGSIRQVYSARIPGNCYTVAYYVENCTYGDSDACRITCDQCNLCMTLIRYNVCNGTEIMQPLYPISGGGGGVGSGLSDPSGYIFDPNMYELGSKKYQQAKNAAEFWHSLSISQQQWVYGNENNINTYRDIIAYINKPENINNNEARNFAKEIIEQMRLNPELKLDISASAKSPANIDVSLVQGTSEAEKKFRCIYEKLTQSPSFKNLFTDTFGTSNRINVKFEIVENLTFTNPDGSISYPNATCQMSSINNNYNNTIKISTNILEGQRSNIEIAKTILHECIHAYLNIKKINCNNGTTIPQINNKLFPELLSSFYQDNCFIDVNGVNQGEHTFMFDYMIPVFQQVLGEVKNLIIPQSHIQIAEEGEYVNNLGSNLTWDWNDFYKYLSVNGLTNTQSFIDEIESNPNKLYLFNFYNIKANQFSKTCN